MEVPLNGLATSSSVISIIDSLLYAIDLEEKAFLGHEDETDAKHSNSTGTSTLEQPEITSNGSTDYNANNNSKDILLEQHSTVVSPYHENEEQGKDSCTQEEAKSSINEQIVSHQVEEVLNISQHPTNNSIHPQHDIGTTISQQNVSEPITDKRMDSTATQQQNTTTQSSIDPNAIEHSVQSNLNQISNKDNADLDPDITSSCSSTISRSSSTSTLSSTTSDDSGEEGSQSKLDSSIEERNLDIEKENVDKSSNLDKEKPQTTDSSFVDKWIINLTARQKPFHFKESGHKQETQDEKTKADTEDIPMDAEDVPCASAQWQTYRKSSHVEREPGVTYKEKKGRRFEVRKGINYSNNVMHIKYNKAGTMRSLHGEVQKLHDERAALKEQLGWSYPQQYMHYSTYQEAKNKDKIIGDPPKGVPVNQYLLEERTNILRDIFILNSLLEIAEENRSFRSQLTVLEKQVGSMFAEVKILETAKGMLEKSKSKNSI